MIPANELFQQGKGAPKTTLVLRSWSRSKVTVTEIIPFLQSSSASINSFIPFFPELQLLPSAPDTAGLLPIPRSS